jgi:hypothetical protein
MVSTILPLSLVSIIHDKLTKSLMEIHLQYKIVLYGHPIKNYQVAMSYKRNGVMW